MKLSRIESAMRVVLKFNQALVQRDLAGMMGCLSENCIFEETNPAPDGTTHKGKPAVEKLLQGFIHDSPNARIEIEEIFGTGMRCVMRWKYSWTDAAGKPGHVRGVDIFRVKDDLICEKFSYVKG